MQISVGGRFLELRQGDITAAPADAIVNAANQHLAGGGGVDGAIHRAGGPEIAAECREIGGCPTGEAVATTAGRLPARHVIHAVAPRWRGGSHEEPELLARAYRSALDCAASRGDRTVAFPSLGTGAYGYPVGEAARVALSTVIEALAGGVDLDSVMFYLFSPADLAAYESALAELSAPGA